ncbi:MAG: hypothetical protein ACTS73_03510 [Arsenophonus sp. NEOnobi-MAG3]
MADPIYILSGKMIPFGCCCIIGITEHGCNELIGIEDAFES